MHTRYVFSKGRTVKHAALGAVISAVAGFSLAAATLAANIQPAYWVPTMDRAPQASFTVVDDGTSGIRGDRPRRDRRGVKVRVLASPSPLVSPLPSKVVPTATTPVIPSELGIPGIVLQAYQQAADELADSDEGCSIDWQTLAGVGKVESGHARNGAVGADGTTFTPILGPVLDGGSFASIPDTDDGALDGDPVWDRAVGPMQFIPGTWAFVGVDGNDDGIASPHNIFDAALSAGVYLCAGSRDLSVRASLDAALHTYNNSDSYVALVLAWIDGYRAGHVTPLPPQSPPPTTTTPTPTPTTPSPTPTATTPSPTPTTPSPTPTTPSATPTETTTTRPPPSITTSPTSPAATGEPSESATASEAPSSAAPSETGTSPADD